jgi:hypothetical protein
MSSGKGKNAALMVIAEFASCGITGTSTTFAFVLFDACSMFYSTQRNETIISKHAHDHAICAVVHQSKVMEILRKSNTL